MDANITQKEARCLWKLGGFWCREIACPQFTNAKAFVLSLICIDVSEKVLTLNLYPTIPRGVITCFWYLSFSTFFFETVGMMRRILCHHEQYYTICSSADADQCVAEKDE